MCPGIDVLPRERLGVHMSGGGEGSRGKRLCLSWIKLVNWDNSRVFTLLVWIND